MNTFKNRRQFLSTSLKAGVACCALMQTQEMFAQDDKKPNPKKLNYCGYTCTAECPMYKATVQNSLELKKKAYEDFKYKEKFNIEFDPDKIYCWGCKITDKPMSIAVSKCTVRKCTIEKGLDCCIECKDLTQCDKELWKSFPKFKEMVIGMQKKYNA